MERIFYTAITIFVGMLVSLHLAMNGKLGIQLESVATSKFKAAAAANAIFWCIGAVTAIIYFLALRPGSPAEFFKAASAPLLTAGMLGASIVFAVTFLIPDKVGGAAAGFIFLVVGQVLMGLVLSHFGLLGSAKDPITLKQVGGLVLLSAGLYLTVFK